MSVNLPPKDPSVPCWVGTLVAVLAAALVATAVAARWGSRLAASSLARYTKVLVVNVIDGDTLEVTWFAGSRRTTLRHQRLGRVRILSSP